MRDMLSSGREGETKAALARRCRVVGRERDMAPCQSLDSAPALRDGCRIASSTWRSSLCELNDHAVI